MPVVKYVPADSIQTKIDTTKASHSSKSLQVVTNHVFSELDRYISIEADHFTKSINTNGITWKILPDHGRTGSALTPFPVTAKEQHPSANSPRLEYEIYTNSIGEFSINAYFSPTLNFHNSTEGLQYAISVDNDIPQVISINKEDKNSISGVWNKWVAENIIIKTSKHTIQQPGKHTIKYWMVNPGVVLQKLVVDFGGVKPSYLGPPETIYEQKK